MDFFDPSKEFFDPSKDFFGFAIPSSEAPSVPSEIDINKHIVHNIEMYEEYDERETSVVAKMT